ncbi:hypothetical protein [Archangium sp.]|jgi:hypothetical protein|uniref:hypothetical protein n=1 Tax=Archangium sp. TaxID=1872627 RepID=UPI00389AE070
MEDIAPNLLPVAISLFLCIFSFAGSRAYARGALSAFIVTFVMAIPAVALSASVGFRKLEMMFMLTLLLAFASAGAGLLAFILGYASASGTTEDKGEGAGVE